jgi:hypothetical protein
VVNFTKHQKPHFHKQKSVIPDPPGGFPVQADPASRDPGNDGNSDSSETEEDTPPKDHQPPIFECDYCDTDGKYFAKLHRDYLAMPPDLIIMAARPSMGKSGLALNVAFQAN